MSAKLTYEFVKRFIEDKGGILLSKEYVNSATHLYVQCENGHVWNPTCNKIQQGHWCKKCGSKNSALSRRGHTIDFVKNFVKDKGFCLSDIYISDHALMLWMCFCENIWEARFADIKRKKSWCRECAKNSRKITVLKKYGVENISQNVEIHKKQTKSMNKMFSLKHWKNGNEVVCRGHFEKQVVEWLNQNKLDFDWQIPFDMPNGKRYFIDLYFKEQNLWIEIKGRWFDEKAKNKWEWFHEKYPNSELWTMKVLERKNILTKSYYYHLNKNSGVAL